MNSENSNNSELYTEEEMNESVGSQLGLVAAAVATGLVISFATVKFLEWNDNRKSKKTDKQN
jgi:hypothetical protein